MRRTLALFLLAASTLGSACKAPEGLREPWVYGLSRSFYPSLSESRRPAQGFDDSEGAAVVLVVLLVLPFALDTVLLPVTVPHDLLLVD